ncbi:MAG: hypothetical protein EON85_10430, partial [Brevundimonas sp.]
MTASRTSESSRRAFWISRTRSQPPPFPDPPPPPPPAPFPPPPPPDPAPARRAPASWASPMVGMAISGGVRGAVAG